MLHFFALWNNGVPTRQTSLFEWLVEFGTLRVLRRANVLLLLRLEALGVARCVRSNHVTHDTVGADWLLHRWLLVDRLELRSPIIHLLKLNELRDVPLRTLVDVSMPLRRQRLPRELLLGLLQRIHLVAMYLLHLSLGLTIASLRITAHNLFFLVLHW